MPSPLPSVALVAAAGALLISGCGDDGAEKAPNPAAERADRPVTPPKRWRTVENKPSGFTIAAPRKWTVRKKADATLIRSDDRLVVVTVAADRSADGRDTSPGRYGRATLQNLPDFEGEISTRVRRVRGSPYRTARIDGTGTLRTSRRAQRITVVAYHRPGQVTYVAIVFRNARVKPTFNDRRVDRVLRSFRAQPPDTTA